MKTKLLIAGLLLPYLIGASPRKKKIVEVNVHDIQETSFYTGCIDGFIVGIEQGWYVRPEHLNAQEVFRSLKENCELKSKIYRKEMGG